MLEVMTPSTDESLTTTAAVKELLGTTSAADDALISSLVTRMSKRAESYVGYPLSVAAYRETVAGYGSRRLMLARTPVRAVTRVYTGTDTGTATQVLTSEFRLDREAGFLDRDLGWEWRVPLAPKPFAFGLEDAPLAGQEEETYLVEYVAGYTRDGIDTGSALWSTEKGTTSTGRTLPQDIEDAVIAKVANVQSGSDDVKSRSVGDLSVTYRGDDMGLVDRAFASLDAYRRSA